MNTVQILTDHTFLTVAAGSGILGMISGVIGTFAVLRKQSLLGDGVSHSALPGVAAAFLLTGEKNSGILLLGALLSGLGASLLISFISSHSKIKFDAALAAVMSGFFGLGTVLLTCAQKLPNAAQSGLSTFIYGQASAMLTEDVALISLLSLILLIIVILFWKELKLFSFDGDFFSQSGFSGKKISLLLSLMTVITVILGIQTVGVVLMSAMLVIPAAAARQWSDRLYVNVITAAVFGSLSGLMGAYISGGQQGIPTGPAIVVSASFIEIFSLLFAPKRGIISKLIKRKISREKLTGKRSF